MVTIICRLNFSNLQKIALTNLEQTVAQSILFLSETFYEDLRKTHPRNAANDKIMLINPDRDF